MLKVLFEQKKKKRIKNVRINNAYFLIVSIWNIMMNKKYYIK